MRNPVKALGFMLRNGNGSRAHDSVASAPSRESDAPPGSEAEVKEPSALVVGEPYIEIWDNDEDAIYDDL